MRWKIPQCQSCRSRVWAAPEQPQPQAQPSHHMTRGEKIMLAGVVVGSLGFVVNAVRFFNNS